MDFFLFLYLNPFSFIFLLLPQLSSAFSNLPASFLIVPQQEDGASSRQATMVPLVIPVSVPVHRGQTDPQGGWAQGRPGQGERPAAPSDRKPSVIVARRRSLRSTMTESFAQVSSLRTRDLNCFPFSHFKGTFFLFLHTTMKHLQPSCL